MNDVLNSKKKKIISRKNEALFELAQKARDLGWSDQIMRMIQAGNVERFPLWLQEEFRSLMLYYARISGVNEEDLNAEEVDSF